MLQRELDKCKEDIKYHQTKSRANLAYYTGRIQQIDYTIELLKGNPCEPVKPIFDIKINAEIKLSDPEKTGEECHFECGKFGLPKDILLNNGCKKCINIPPF